MTKISNDFGTSSANAQMKATNTKCVGLLSIKSANDWIEESIKRPDPKMFFHDLIVENENTVIFAASNVGKSILATQIAEDIAKVEKVLYLDLELSSKQFQMRYSDTFTGKAHRFPANFTRAEINPELMVGPNLEQEILDSIEEAAKRGTKFFIIDNITFICKDLEKATKACAFMLKLIHLKKKYELTTIVIAHTPKRRRWRPITGNDLAGSAKLINFFDAAIAMAPSAQDENFRYLKQVKVRTGEFQYNEENVLVLEKNLSEGYLKFDFVGCEREEEHLNAIEGNDKAEELVTILNMQRAGMSRREIAEALGIGKSTVQRRIEEAKKNNITIPEEKEETNESVPFVPDSLSMGQMGQPSQSIN